MAACPRPAIGVATAISEVPVSRASSTASVTPAGPPPAGGIVVHPQHHPAITRRGRRVPTVAPVEVEQIDRERGERRDGELRCAEEARLGEEATRHLLELLQQGPFLISGPLQIAHDEYGRELRTLSRPRRDGTVQSIADDMVASGTARRYDHGARQPWC